jgi:hypothetical protein
LYPGQPSTVVQSFSLIKTSVAGAPGIQKWLPNEAFSRFLLRPVIPFLPVAIDIDADSDEHGDGRKGDESISVAILSNSQFNAVTEVASGSLRFGPTGTETNVAYCEDEGGDDDDHDLPALVCHFHIEERAHREEVRKWILTGTTVNGALIRGVAKSREKGRRD